MPLLIFALSMYVAAIIQRYLQAYAPSNLLVAHVRRNDHACESLPLSSRWPPLSCSAPLFYPRGR